MTAEPETRRRRPGRGAVIIAAIGVLLGAALTAAAFVLFRPAGKDKDEALTIAVVGDVFTAGRLNRVVWPTMVAQRTGWSVANFALPGSGYANDGLGGYAFTYQVDRALAARPHTVVLFGGFEDGNNVGTGNIGEGALNAIGKVILAGRQALVIGPTWFENPVPPTIVETAKEIRRAAEQSGVPFLDALDPPWLAPNLMLPDRSGPTDLGQSVIADKMAAWLRTEVTP